MIHSNYKNLLNTITTRNKGFWRIEAISRLSNKIKRGHHKFEYLKNLLSRQEKNNEKHSFLQINSAKTPNKKINLKKKPHNRASQTFFVTQIRPFKRKRKHNFNHMLFMNKDEEDIYSPIELHPFEIKYIRKRDENQKYFNVQKLKKEIETNYNYIKNEQDKNRPFSSHYKSKLKKDYFGYESKSIGRSNLSINNYYSNNTIMNQRIKNNYKLKYNNNNICRSPNNNINEKWRNIHGRKKIISAFLNNRAAKDIFGEENELFENIKKNKISKTIFSNYSTKNQTEDNNFSNRTGNSHLLFQKKNILFNMNNINKEQINKRIFNSIDNENRFHLNIVLNDNQHNKINIIEKNNVENGKTIHKKNHFNIKQHFKNK
jgi:hypothetical protein